MKLRATLCFAALLAALPASAASRPNILFLFSDDHALNAISAYGGPLAKLAPTPNLDRLATQGAVFTRSYCCNSICGPSRAAIITGKHSHINGFVDNDTCTFDGSQTTFPKLLQQVGYQTAIIGKWHLVTKPTGFDYWEILPGQGNYYNPAFITKAGQNREEGYVTDLITDKALAWLKDGRDKSKPFVLMCQHKAPHRNWAPAPRHLDLFDDVAFPEPSTLFDDYSGRSELLKTQKMTISKDFYWGHDMKFKGSNEFPAHFEDGIPNGEYQRMSPAQQEAWDKAYETENQQAIADIRSGKLKGDDITRWKYQRYLKDYLRCVRAVDESVGKILDYLDQSGLAENTLVIYSSDQGFYLGEHGWYDKRWIFEESLAMPFLVRWPGVVKPGTRCDALIQNIDYAPTFLEAAGAPVPAAIQGRSLLPLLKDTTAKPAGWRDAIYYFYSGESTHKVPAHDGLRTERHKLVFFPKTGEYNLFDLATDPHELKSLHNDPAQAELLERLKAKLAGLRQQYRMSPSTLPMPRFEHAWWKQRHQEKLKLARQGGHDLVFIGDSITQGWEGHGKALWEERYAPRKALNLGYSGDRTEHVLWRLLNGELENVDPKVFVLMIGTNNTGHNQAPAEQTAEGVKLILELLRDRKPDAKILLLSIFPREEQPDGKLRKLNDAINERIKGFADGQNIRWLDLTKTFVDQNGVLPKTIMPDFLHPQAEGYQLWADALEPALKDLGL